MPRSDIQCDLMVIGAGMAGMASALFAANRGVTTVQVGMPGEIGFASGLLDLMGVHPVKEGRVWNNPWDAIDRLTRDIPEHPYARIGKNDIRQAVEEFTLFLAESGFPYHTYQDRNADVITPIGTIKKTYCVPENMWNGVKALNKRSSCLLIDFSGLKGFSARQIKETLHERWPELRTARVSFPDTSGEIYTEHMARQMEDRKVRQKLALAVSPHLRGAQVVGLPAILGISRTREVISDFEKQLGVSVFEIPTMPPSVTGLRLRQIFEQQLPKRGVRTLFQQKVLGVRPAGTGEFKFNVGNHDNTLTVGAKGAILASGRFFGKGLHADGKRIRETIFGLPVYQPKDRTLWHCKDFLNPAGHAINLAGLETDDSFRPLDHSGCPAFKTLFAAGSILAHQDWMRMKCGSGLAVATAYIAVNSFLKQVS